MDADFFLSRCEREITDAEVVLNAPSQLAADGLRRCCIDVAKWALERGRNLVIIHWPGDNGKGYEIPSWFASMQGSDNSEELLQVMAKVANQKGEEMRELPVNQESNEIDSDPDLLLVIPEMELNENNIYDSSKPTYINRIFDQENLFANPAALVAQGQKPKLIGMTAYALNNPEELDRRCNFLVSGDQLREYEYEAWRWYYDIDASRWRLKRMSFVSNFRRIDNINLGKHLQVNGQPMWLGQVLKADELPGRIP